MHAASHRLVRTPVVVRRQAYINTKSVHSKLRGI